MNILNILMIFRFISLVFFFFRPGQHNFKIWRYFQVFYDHGNPETIILPLKSTKLSTQEVQMFPIPVCRTVHCSGKVVRMKNHSHTKRLQCKHTFSCFLRSWCLCRKYWSFSCCLRSWCLSCKFFSSMSQIVDSRSDRWKEHLGYKQSLHKTLNMEVIFSIIFILIKIVCMHLYL